MASFGIDASLLLAFFVVLGGVNAASVKHSAGNWCLPDTFTTRLYGEVTRVKGKESPVVSFPVVTVSRDQVNKRFAADFTIGGVTRSLILLCTESGTTAYVFYKATKRCQKYQLSDCPLSPDPLCLPSRPSLVGSFQLGAGSATLGAQLWTYSSVCSQAQEMGSVIVTPSAPVAFARAVRFIDSNATLSVAAMFTDFTLSIADPDVFTPPSYCNGEAVGGDEKPEFDINALFEIFTSFC